MREHREHEQEQDLTARNRVYAAAIPLLGTGGIHTRAETEDFTLTITCDKGSGFSMRETGVVAWKRRMNDLAIPHLTVTCRLIDEADRSFGERVTPFVWHPFLSHYRALWQTPEAGMYRFEIDVLVTRGTGSDEDPKRDERLRMVLGPIFLTD